MVSDNLPIIRNRDSIPWVSGYQSINTTSAMKLSSNPFCPLLFAATVLLVTPAPSATFLWDGGGADNNWTSIANWNPDGVPLGATDTIVALDGIVRTTTVQNIATPFVLNRLEILNGPAAGGKAAFAISGNQFQFVANGATQPRIFSTREATSSISNAIDIASGTTLNLQINTYGVVLSGVISGGGGIDKLQNAGGITLSNSGNTFSGGLTIRGIDNDWYKVDVTASNAMGSGAVNLYGGTLATSFANPGGLIFSNTTTHGNAINLFQDSPIFAGLPGNNTANVTLNGNVSLGASSLYLRGGATGNVAGVISGTGGIQKRDNGTWTLSGSNSFTGATTITSGVLVANTLANGGSNSSLGAATTAAGNLVFDGGTLRYTGATATTDRDFTIIDGKAAVFDVTQAGTTLTFDRIQGSTVAGNRSITKNGAGTLLFGFDGPGGSSGYLASIQAFTVNQGTLDDVAGDVVQMNVGRLSGSGAAITMGDGAVFGLNTALETLTVGSNQTVRYTGTTSTATISGGFTFSGPGSGGFNTKTFDINDGAAAIDLSLTSGIGIYSGGGANPPAVSNLVKTGAGTLSLGGNNGYRGTTQINSGTIRVGNTGALGTTDGGTELRRVDDGNRGTLDLNGFSITEALSFEDAGNAGTSLGSGGFLVNSSGTASTLSGSVTLNKNGTVQGTGEIILSNVVSGTGNLFKTGTGALTLSGNNNYSGTTTVDQGVLNVRHSNALGTTAGGTTINQVNGAILDLASNVTVPDAITFSGAHAGLTTTLRNSSGNNTLSGLVTIGGNQIRLQSNGGSLTFTGGVSGTNTFFVVNSGGGSTNFTTNPINIGASGNFWADSGGLTVLGVAGNTWGTTNFTNGTLRMGVANALPAAAALNVGGVAYGPNGTLDLNGFSQAASSLGRMGTTAATTSVQITSLTPATLTLNQSTTSNYDGGFTGAVTLIKNDAGTLILSGANAPVSNHHTGDTVVNGGTLEIGNTGILRNSTLDTGAAGGQQVTFSVVGTNTYQLGGLKGSDDLSFGANTLRIGGNNQSNTFSGALVGTTGALVKTGSGIQTLTAASSYIGGTTVENGSLMVNNTTGTATGTGPVTINNGATLGGSGSISPSLLTINAGGVFAPGNSPGTTTINGDLLLSPGSLFGVDLAIGGVTTETADLGLTGTDRAVVNGTITLANAILSGVWGGTSNNLFRGNYDSTTMMWILENDATDLVTGTFANSFLAPGFSSLFGGVTPHLTSVGGQNFALFYRSQADVYGASGLIGGNDILLIAVPEPSRMVFTLGGVLGLLFMRRRSVILK
jgi:fibronectin-binding autotransporter adhesin